MKKKIPYFFEKKPNQFKMKNVYNLNMINLNSLENIYKLANKILTQTSYC